MYLHALIRASLGFVGFCLVAFVQQSASGSKTPQGKFFSRAKKQQHKKNANFVLLLMAENALFGA